MVETVELHAAWRWDCPECGREQWVRGIQLETEHLSEDQRDRLEEAEWWVLYPEMVQCNDCKSPYYVQQGLDEKNKIEDEVIVGHSLPVGDMIG